jgi:hypothetical protein
MSPDPATIPAKFTTDVMKTDIEWKYMTHCLPDRRRPIREDASKATDAFLMRLGTVWRQRTKGSGSVRVAPAAEGAAVSVAFLLHGKEVVAIEFPTTRILSGIGEADKIVALVVAEGGGVARVRKLAASLAPKVKVVAEVVSPKKKAPKKVARKKA